MFCECRDIVKRYDGRTVLHVEHLLLPEKQISAVVGPNGSGKTTLLEIISLLTRPDGGRMRLWDSPARFGDAPLRSSVVMVMHPGYMFRGTVLRNVLYGLRSAGAKRAEAHRRAAEAMELVGVSALQDRDASRLSSGERQRVNLARAIALHPRALLLDEPTANVDSDCIAVIRDVLMRLRDQDGMTIVHTSPSHNALESVTDRVTELGEGRVVSDGRPPSSSVSVAKNCGS